MANVSSWPLLCQKAKSMVPCLVEAFSYPDGGNNEGDRGHGGENRCLLPQVFDAHTLHHDATQNTQEIGEGDDQGNPLRHSGHGLDGEDKAAEKDGGYQHHEAGLHGLELVL